MIRHRLLLVVALALATPVTAGRFALDAPADIEALLAPHWPEEGGSPRQLQALFSEILATEGYFSPVFEFSDAAETRHLALDPGPRTTIAALDVTITGPLDARSKDALLAGWGLPVGQPFRQAGWNAAKQRVLAELLAFEHADARLVDSQAAIDPDTRQASLRAHYDAGPRYRFGELRVEGLQRYSPDLVRRYNRAAQAGQPYREERLNALQAALQATPYFASVQAVLDRDHAVDEEDGRRQVPVIVRVRERPAHRLAFGAGASSNTGARAEFNYHTPNLAGQAWSLDSGMRLEQKKQTTYADIFLPPDERKRQHSFGGMIEATDIQGLKTRRHAFGAQTVQQRGSVEQRLSLNWQQEHREPQDAEAVTSRALVPDVTWTWRQLDNPLDPRSGSVVQAQIGGGSKAALSDQNFVRTYFRFQRYQPLGRLDTLILRGEFGATVADSRRHIPQDYLFRTGGTGSVRGYTYQSLGIKEGSATVGGRYLATISAEATHWLDDEWGVAAFVDAGDAVDQLADLRLAVGTGLGARWRSPAGPLGIDLAYGVRQRGVALHFSLAIPF